IMVLSTTGTLNLGVITNCPLCVPNLSGNKIDASGLTGGRIILGGWGDVSSNEVPLTATGTEDYGGSVSITSGSGSIFLRSAGDKAAAIDVSSDAGAGGFVGGSAL